MTPQLLNELKKIIEPLLKAHADLMKEFIPAKAGLDPERAKALEGHIHRVEAAIRGIQNAKSSDELKSAINEANAIFADS